MSITCNDCGIAYDKKCRLCHMIKSVNIKYMNELILCRSDLSQKDIVRETLQFILKNKKNPLPQEIDPQVKLSEYPLYKYNKELCNLGHKIFVTNLFDFSYLIKFEFGDGFTVADNFYSVDRYLLDDKILSLPFLPL
jgi:hypothetical protein